MQEAWRIKKGDKVFVISGKSKGQTGEILRVDRDARRVFVSGVNLVKRHEKPRLGNPGGIVAKEASIHASNVMLLDPATGKPTRVGYRFLEDGRKVRFSKSSGEQID